MNAWLLARLTDGSERCGVLLEKGVDSPKRRRAGMLGRCTGKKESLISLSLLALLDVKESPSLRKIL